MAEKAGERVRKAMENVITELDKSKLRRMQVSVLFVFRGLHHLALSTFNAIHS